MMSLQTTHNWAKAARDQYLLTVMHFIYFTYYIVRDLRYVLTIPGSASCELGILFRIYLSVNHGKSVLCHGVPWEVRYDGDIAQIEFFSSQAPQPPPVPRDHLCIARWLSVPWRGLAHYSPDSDIRYVMYRVAI
jgi:hypothetical protein